MARTLTRRPAADDTDETTETEAPRRGSRRSTEDEAPKRSRRAPLHTEDDSEGDEPDEDEAPRSSRGRRQAEPERDTASGWGGYEKHKSAGSDFPDNLVVTDEAILIKVLDDAPFAVYLQHWIERKGKKSFTCNEENCPLCDDLGDKPKTQAMFNVVDYTDPDNPVVRPWTVGNLVANLFKNYAKDKKTAPINRDDLYWSVSKSGGGSKGRVAYQVTPVKERDLGDDWDMDPATEADLDKFDAAKYGKDLVQYSTRKQLQEIADEALGD